uniref:Rho GTPase-activating protein 20 n=2 Tax=Hirondellea gigas TaxID=1518452 RepID=A0A6A7FXG9_9CRUS
MVLKRVTNIRRSYRFHRSGSTSSSNNSNNNDDTTSNNVSAGLAVGDEIFNTEGVKVGWMLDGGRRSSGGGGGPLFSPSSHSLPCGACTHASYPHYWTIGRVKFGVPLEQVCKNNDIPGPLLVLMLKLNKEGPNKKDVFRAPGHQASMKKLIHFLHNGRLVNIDNFSVYTIASVLKKFLRKLPDGIFGRSGEEELFNMIQLGDTERQRDLVHRLIASKPIVTQHLLVLLFGTFRVIASNAERCNTGMTSEALGVSVAPSFFRSCVAHGKTASMDDVLRFKVATQIMRFMIDNFGVSNLFGRENYEYYARITGRILKVEEDWIFAFRYPPDSLVAPMAGQEESQSTPALIHIPECGEEAGVSGRGGGDGGEGCSNYQQMTGVCSGGSGGAGNGSLRMVVPENNLRESCTRLSISLEENGLYKVHERQTERMKTRSEWFLTPQQCRAAAEGEMASCGDEDDGGGGGGGGDGVGGGRVGGGYYSPPPEICQPHTVLYARHKEALAAARKHGSDDCKLLRRSSSKDKERRLVRRSSSKKDKENGQKKRDALRVRSASAEVKGHPLLQQQQHSSSPISTLHNITHSIVQHNMPQPLQQQNVMYTLLQQQQQQQLRPLLLQQAQLQQVMMVRPLQQQQQQVVPTRPLHHQHSHDLLLASPSRRGVLLGTSAAAGCSGAIECASTADSGDEQQQQQQFKTIPVTELECTETDVQRVHVSNTYKPRI